jgi:signal peptidase I
MDISALLLIGFAAAGAIILGEAWYFKPRRSAASGGITDHGLAEPVLVNYARSFFPIILIVLVVRSFWFEPFRIPSESMMPNLVDGDFIIVTKYAYGLRLPLFNTKVLATGEPHRGDVVVFRLPSDPSIHYIKRLIGLPGDHVVVRDNHLTINGSPIPLAPEGRYPGGYGFTGSPLAVERFGATEHEIMFAADRSSTDVDTIVPAGQYFFMGDNRNDSQDSRFPQVGFVPEANLVGRATRIWMNWDFPSWPRWNRIGTRIQ